MRIKKLNFGVDISDINLSNCSNFQLKDIINLCAEERLVVLKKQQISIERFDEINDIFGIHQPADIWASHTDFPKIIRVTNKEISKGKKGFLHQKVLDWHSNSLAPDPEECVALWCIETGISGGSTEFACGVHAYNRLDDSINEEIKNAIVVLTNKIGSKTYLKVTNYGNFVSDEWSELEKTRSRSRHFSGEEKSNPYYENKVHREGKSYFIQKNGEVEKGTSLIVKHPVTGVKGLFFPVYNISEIKELKTPFKAKEIFHILMNSYVGKKGKIYRHYWQKGDLILSDQIHSLHRRLSFEGIRELYRTSFWYHNSNNKSIGLYP